MNTPVTRGLASVVVLVLASTSANAQMVYYSSMSPVMAGPVMVAAPMASGPAYVANYTPSGNYAAVTAFSPPVVSNPSMVAVTSAYAPVSAPMPVTSFYAPTVAFSPVMQQLPVTAFYAPAMQPVSATAFYAPVMQPAPVTAFYTPTLVTPLYRRGPFGALRPVRTAYFIPY